MVYKWCTRWCTHAGFARDADMLTHLYNLIVATRMRTPPTGPASTPLLQVQLPHVHARCSLADEHSFLVEQRLFACSWDER